MSAGERSRGQPLLVLCTIVGVWLIGRVMLWEPPFPLPIVPPALLASRDGNLPAEPKATVASRERTEAVTPPALASAWRSPMLVAEDDQAGPVAGAAVAELPPLWLARAALPAAAEPLVAMPVRRAAGHHMLLAAAFADLALPPEVARFYRQRDEQSDGRTGAAAGLAVADRPLLGTGVLRDEAAAGRWSGDAWLLWRNGGSNPAAPGGASYGRSQAGAVIRFRIAPQSAFAPTVYARATRSLEGPRQAEVAAGLSARPIRALPVVLAGEARVADTAAGREVRPAAFATTQMPPRDLPLGLRGEAYLQAGWVGGRYETAFVDGQVRVDRSVLALGEDKHLRAGLAAWGGAQKGAGRLDIGPSATLGFKLGDASSRLAVDYRLRVVGEAAPASGPTLTFSAGF